MTAAYQRYYAMTMDRTVQQQTFEKFGLSEAEISDIIVRVISLHPGSTLPVLIRGVEVKIDQNFNIRYNKGKRFPLLEKAIKQFVTS